jgi:hypothetical protein
VTDSYIRLMGKLHNRLCPNGSERRRLYKIGHFELSLERCLSLGEGTFQEERLTYLVHQTMVDSS